MVNFIDRASDVLSLKSVDPMSMLFASVTIRQTANTIE